MRNHSHEYLADVIAKTEGEAFHKFIQRAAVYREPVGATAFVGLGGEQFLDTGVDLTLVEREEVTRDEFVYWVTPVIRDAMWGNLTADEKLEMHAHAYQWYDAWISGSSESDYRYLEEAVRHALEVGNIRGACPHVRALGQYFDRMVLYRQGRAIMETVAVRVSDAVIEEAKAEKDIAVSLFLNTYTTSLWKLGDLKKAIWYLEKELAIKLEGILFIFHGNYAFMHHGFLVKPGMTHLENACNCHSCESRNPCLLTVKKFFTLLF
ncbi:MAG: hypothetical protein HQL61_03295 [Magnetococcales bacterium]|nr:hypothetical protein [Nitrospirota bacterium]